MLDFYEKNNGMEFKDWNPEYRNLDDISNWVEKQRKLYEDYYNELWQVKQIISDYDKVKEIIRLQSKIVSEYTQSYGLFKQDKHFNPEELDHGRMVEPTVCHRRLEGAGPNEPRNSQGRSSQALGISSGDHQGSQERARPNLHETGVQASAAEIGFCLPRASTERRPGKRMLRMVHDLTANTNSRRE